MKKHYRSENNCLNCEAIIPDKFCPSCGQENLDLHENFIHLVLHSVGHYFHLESKFFKSMVPLLTKPGLLTKEYFAGKRASHLNPISMYIFISILFFFLFTANTNINEKGILKENTAEKTTSPQAKAQNAEAVAGKAAKDIGNYIKPALTNAQVVNDTASNRNLIKEAATKEKASFGEFNIPLHSFNEKFRKVKNDELQFELFKNKLISHLPKIMFILLPLFALILKLVSIRSKKFYTEHLIYSIHVHSFLFLFGSILIILKWLLPFVSGWIQFLGILVMLWYIYRSMRNIYRSTRWRTITKCLLLAFAYTFLLFLSGLTVVVATLYTM
ncbi:DUF3667 domain-containing protein [Pontibacter sp. H249]|uniref:DUF3667 domain-containing protein n=1 Tax=Pontibacter sp. H249 TaxID=3133420 RepID=UPI0030C3868D